MNNKSISLVPTNSFNSYLAKIRSFPILTEEEEYQAAKQWQKYQDYEAAKKLITSHLRLVVKIALTYKGYGLPVNEVVSEGNIGLMQAVRKFEPDKGFRLSTYAIWWIKAAIKEYILRSWSLVKIGTTTNQRKLFFNLRKEKNKIAAFDDGDLLPDQVKKISTNLGVNEKEVIEMNRRMSGDSSLNNIISTDTQQEWQDWIIDEGESQEEYIINREETANRKSALKEALAVLSDREKKILIARKLQENPNTLKELSNSLGISRERVRQIESQAFKKIQKNVKKIIANKYEALPQPSM